MKEIIFILFKPTQVKWETQLNGFLLFVIWIEWNMVEVWLSNVINNICISFFIIVIVANKPAVVNPPHIKQVLLCRIFRINDINFIVICS